ncbi:MAG: DUF5722 domain-containing protein [Planctomycetota bacterium]
MISVDTQPSGILQLRTTGGDPYLTLDPIPVDQRDATHHVLAFEYFCPDNINGIEIFYGKPFHPGNRLSAGQLPPSQSWQTFSIDLRDTSNARWTAFAHPFLRVDFGGQPGRQFQVRQPVLRSLTAAEMDAKRVAATQRSAKLLAAKTIDNYYQHTFPILAPTVRRTNTEIQISLPLSEGVSQSQCIEILPDVSVAEMTIQSGQWYLPLDRAHPVATAQSANNGMITIPRLDQQHDHGSSRFSIAKRIGQRWQIQSHWRHAQQPPSANQITTNASQTRPIKGLGGISPAMPLQDLLDLGIQQITHNLPITSLLSLTPKPGFRPFHFRGQTYYANEPTLRHYDKLVHFAGEHNIRVSGILLLTFANHPFAQRLLHPESSREGAYAMPNLTNPQGVLAYQAVLELLAQRYAASNADQRHIHNWIIHNEIDHGREWTNMGQQPQSVYMDHYLRSMRLVHDAMRRHDDHARVFISLTHHWNRPAHPQWRYYDTKSLMQRLIESNRIEGDFQWGVAHHPYPENLRDPRSWNDKTATNDFDTRRITPKNLAVLDRWMQLPQMRDANGQVRGVLLSEQGFNTPDLSPESQALQSEGLRYMWQQMKGLDSIQAFHLHRWMDHPKEGGLLLGLRQWPNPGEQLGKKKDAWNTYKNLPVDPNQ